LAEKRHLHSLTQYRILSWNEVLQDAAAYGPAGLVVVAGDFNLNTSKRRVAEVLAGAGFRNAVPSAHLATIPPRHLLEAGRPSTGLLFAGKCRKSPGSRLD